MPACCQCDCARGLAPRRTFTLLLAALILTACAAPAQRPKEEPVAPADSPLVPELQMGSMSADPTGSAPRVERLSMGPAAIPGSTHLRGISWKSGGERDGALDQTLGLPEEPLLAAFRSERQPTFGTASVALPMWTPVIPPATATATAEAKPEAAPVPPPQRAMAGSLQQGPTPAPAAAIDGALAPAPAPPPENLDRPEWIVNVATYADVDLARQHAQRLVGEGFKAAVREEKVRGRSSFRVVIESLSTESAAQSALTHLADQYGERAAWVMRKR
jgi:hypothetical protein